MGAARKKRGKTTKSARKSKKKGINGAGFHACLRKGLDSSWACMAHRIITLMREGWDWFLEELPTIPRWDEHQLFSGTLHLLGDRFYDQRRENEFLDGLPLTQKAKDLEAFYLEMLMLALGNLEDLEWKVLVEWTKTQA